MENLPERSAISPMTILCPLCQAKAGELCEGQVVHIERIKASLVADMVARKGLK
jgi:Zn finger protein HypA/HybF involved in hydrogenase expression